MALEQSRGYYVAISSIGAQVRIPGNSDMNISKHALNRLVEFIVLGSFLFLYKFIDTESLITSYGTAQSIPAYVRLHSRPVSSARVCTSRLESKRPSIQSSCPQQRRSISHLGVRTGFLEGACELRPVRPVMVLTCCVQVFLHKLGHRRGGVRLERCDS